MTGSKNPEKCKRYDCPSRLNCSQHPEARELVGCPYCQKFERKGGLQE